MPNAKKEENVTCKLIKTPNLEYYSNIEQFSKNMLEIQKKISNIEDVRNVLELVVTKSKIYQKEKLADYQTINECHLECPQSFYFEKMKEFANKLPPNILLLEWEENIRNLISANLRTKYMDIFEDQMLETKTRYYESMHDMAIKKVIAIECQDICNLGLEEIPPYKLAGRTEFYPKFLKNRCAFKKKYYLPHKLMKNIVAKAHFLMPKWICDFGRYRSEFDYLDFNRFLDLVENDTKKGALMITSVYYSDIVRLISQPRYLSDVPSFSLPNFLNCANNLLALQIITLMIDTIEYLLQIFKDKQLLPLFKLQLKCEENNLFLSPTMVEICNAFYNIINQIKLTAQQLSPLESWVSVKIHREYIKVELPEWYLKDTYQRLEEILRNTFRPFNDYVAKLHEKFNIIFDPKSHDIYTRMGHSFQEKISQVEDFNRLIRDINGMPDHEYFSIGIINQVAAKAGLLYYAEEMRRLIIEELVKSHRNYNLEICKTFEGIRDRALHIPYNTKELLELGEYMLYAASTLMRLLEEKITLSLRMMASLIGMTTLTKDHIELNNDTIHWLKRIRPIFEQNSAMYEQTKFELEEKLVKKIDDLNARVEDMYPRLKIMNDMDYANRIREYIEFMRKFARDLDRMDERVNWINEEEKLFKYPLSVYPRINELKEIIMPYYDLIYRGYQWQRHRDVWLDGPFEYLDSNDVENKATDYFSNFSKINKQYRTRIKMEIAMNYPHSFTGSPDDSDPLQQPAPLKLSYQLMEDIKWFKQYIPLLAVFRNPAMRQIHWDEMSVIAGFDLTPDAGTTFRKIIMMNLMEEIEKYETISISATKQLALADLLAKMISEWDDVLFLTIPYKDSGVNILTQLDDTQMLLEDHIIKVEAMRGSAFVKLIEEEVKTFYFLLHRIHSTIEEWTKVQVQWMYLLPIFSSKDIVAQLPEEEVLFFQVDRIFRSAMNGVAKDPRVRETAGSVGLLEIMQEANILMEKVNEGVLNYLEKKRLFFPRFFFLSNDDMLEILSETKEPLRVQPHLRKCFEGINRLRFDEELEICSMFSEDYEEVKMQERISTAAARGCVERWLIQVEEQMLRSVRHEILMSYLDYEVNKRDLWVLIWPGMVVLCVSQIYWTMEVQNSLMTRMPSTMEVLHEKLMNQILEMVELVKGHLTKQNRTTLNALITLDVHAMDVVKLLINRKIINETDFEWLAQLRYYWEDDVFVRIIYTTVNYAYEYIGNCSRLVITPLTDRCYRTLIGAYSLNLNGAPEGPAGTGKTETTKDLGRAVAVQCVVFNCSEGLDYKNMGKFFKGLASCGAWSCFDEFNRIDLEVLSVVAQQILCIIQAVRAKLETFVFEGTELKLNAAVYVCITMNPGYAGRSELPDNLKVLFRTVAMMVPDYAMIAEIFLYSSGFGTARELSTKIVTTYKLCSEQLSSQSHYDYGMRAVKTVLTAAQNIKLQLPDENESVLLLRSVIDVNLPKFLAHDVPLFQGIVSDLFPGLELPAPSYDILLKAVHEVCDKKNLQPVNGFLLKIIQTFEMMIVRHGFMLVGEPFGGKTSILHTLASALTSMFERKEPNGIATKYFTINPKSITLDQLYGFFDPVSSEWTDGICAVAFRRYSTEDTPDRKWIIFDGPVDAVWIENLNTVLDDNKKLCLTSGEIIQMTGVMSMIFETMDLEHASPATVSRCGMIYVEPRVLGWEPFLDSWINILNPMWKQSHENEIKELFHWLMDPCLEFIRKNCHATIVVGQIHQVVSTLNIFEIYMEDAVQQNLTTFEQFILPWLQATMLMSMVWGIGGTLDFPSRILFNNFFLSFWKNEQKEYPLPEFLVEILISIPTEDLIHDCFYTYRGRGAWRRFADMARQEEFSEVGSIVQLIIPTVDTVKYQSLFLKHIQYHKRFLLYGDTGTGKSFYINDLIMNKLGEEEYLPNFITFTPHITAAQTQELIVLKLYKRRRNRFGPLAGTFCIVFIDDVNMPAKEIYGSQPPIELLRQFFDHEVWFDLKKPEMIYIYDTMFVCAMGLPGGSRQVLYNRFLRHFNLFTIDKFSEETMTRIFTNIAFIGLQRHGFTTAIMPVIMDFVNATMNIFQLAQAELRPTPAKSHYLFNLRDFSRVITGCTMIRIESVETRSDFTKLWVHETLRVFGDRLIDTKDRHWLFVRIRETVTSNLRESFDTVFNYLPKIDDQLTEESLRSLIFGTFMDVDTIPADRHYEEVKSMDEYLEVAISYLEEYNITHRHKMDIVLFRYALEHLARICRILVIPCGSLLMVGVGGSGRQSLTKLASNIAALGLFQPEMGSAYGLQEWRDDVKKVLINSGGVGKDYVFLLTEGQMKTDIFLNDIDSLLNSGEVPNIFTIEERQEIIEMTRLAAQGGDRNLDISVLAILSFFRNRCKEKLHIMLCFSPIGDTFRIRLRLYPSLVNCCTIDWFDVWPEDALEQVALRSTTDINIDETVKVNAVIACKFFHVCAKDISSRFYTDTGRKTYITTAGFLDLIQSYAELMKEKQEELILARDRYLNGLDKLQFAAEQISEMRVTLSELRPQLEASARETTETMKKIETENISVEKATIMVKKDEDMANVQAEIAMNLKTECEADLAEALPALEEALAALDTLKPADIAVVRTMRSPPAGVRLVMAAVCVMLGIPPLRVENPITGKKENDYWTPSKRLLGDMRFLETLRQYDKDNIPPHIMNEIKTVYMTDKNFEPKIVARASSAAEGLCKWVRAMVLYDEVIKVVAPKREKLQIAQRDYENTVKFLNERRELLAELTEKLNVLKESLRVILAKKIELENEVTICRNKLIRAEKLISGLGGEKDRWTIAAENLQKSYDTLPGDILISCSMIAYLGPFTSPYRIESLEKWTVYVKNLKIPCSEDFDFVKILGSEIKINSWNIFGLPRDLFSIENAIIMDNSKRWSLFIDPQSQANKWIRNMEKQNELEIVKLTDLNYMNIIEKALEYGKPVLIENVLEELTPPLEPILMKTIYKMGPFWFIALGEKIIEYNLRFRLYITTKLRNPHYLPEIFNKVTVINFALTIGALEDQLLGIVVAKERPDLQEKREYLIVQSAANREALQQVEDNILKTLSVAGARILEDEEAIEILDSSKILSIDILKKQAAAKKTEAQIEGFRQNYKPIAVHSSALYYTITDLPNIDPMYQYSLMWFINLYIHSIETANKSIILERRLAFLQETFTYNLYQNVCRSLFEKDKLLYSFVLYTTILMTEDAITREEMTFFLSGGVVIAGLPENPVTWLTDKSWGEICRVQTLPNFTNFQFSFTRNVDAWKEYYDLLNPEKAPIPEPWEEKLTPFQKLIIMRMIRTDKVMIAIQQFVEAGMGLKFVLPPPFDISKSFAESSSLIPLIFILSPGSDPMEALTSFAETMNFQERFHSISLGQGQGPIAQKLIERAQYSGEWVCLQNCHLAASWMPMLEDICDHFDPSNTHVHFRLWLTSYPSEYFPITILQNGVKMTNEPPTGLQNNIMRSYKSEATKNIDAFYGETVKRKAFSKLLYSLCFFHAVVQERRNYGSQGWNIKYGFNESDLQISVQQLYLYINDYEDVPFKAIVYLTGECNYGGRVTDDRDRRCLNTILQDFYNPNVIINPNYAFADIGPEYNLPKRYEYDDFIKQIQGIPLNPPPEAFGLHMNAGITRDIELANTFFHSMLMIQGAVVIGDAIKQDEIMLNMKKDIYDRMPELFDIEEAQKQYPIVYMESMNTVLIQELVRYNILLKEIKQSLDMLEKTVKGLIVMTPAIEILGNYILSARIPPSWINACAYPSLKPLPNFINDFLDRLNFFEKWLKEGIPKTFWISGFSFVHAFLTATTQNFARKYKIPIDRIDFDYKVLPKFEMNESPIDGVYVYGMFLAGARWNLSNMLLAESYPKVLWEPMPIIWMKPSVVDAIHIKERYECPVYITSARFGVLKTTGHSTNYVLSILLETNYPVSHWIKRGLALICQLDN